MIEVARSRSSPPPDPNGRSLDDAVLVARAQSDPRAFAAVYGPFLDPVHQDWYRRLGSREAAEDTTSLIFERVLNTLSGYRGGCFRAWLFTIAHTVITDTYRSARRQEPLEAAEELSDPGLQPEALAGLADEQRLLRAVLPLLPVEQQRVMELRRSGLLSTEVAHILGRTPESVRTVQRRAIIRLQTLLQRHPRPTTGPRRVHLECRVHPNRSEHAKAFYPVLVALCRPVHLALC